MLIGLVAPETSMTQLRMDVVRTDLDLEAGRLLEVRIAGTDVLCQLMDGINKEEILFQKNTRGYVLAHAKMIGHWNADKARFETVRWVPHLNSPVYLVDCCPATPLRDAVGHFPGTDYPVTVDVDSLVTHNAAILGILGSGKSCLALELVERMIAQKIKVICFDLTDQYAQELAVHRVPDEESKVVDELRGIGNAGKDKVNQNVEEGGSALAFKKKVHEQLAGFLGPSKANYLRIYNPVTFEVWRQDSKPYQGKASMASLTPTEVTRIFTEAALEVAQSLGMTDRARCCLVFEEAHSIIPEWSATASEGDRSATNGTAKAILQGRKFGLGCLVITQRTANVTKSILDQCNTIFALRVFDATGTSSAHFA